MSSPDTPWFGEVINYSNGSQWNSPEVFHKIRDIPSPKLPCPEIFDLSGPFPTGMMKIVQVTISARCSKLSCVPNNNSPGTRTPASRRCRSASAEQRVKKVMYFLYSTDYDNTLYRMYIRTISYYCILYVYIYIISLYHLFLTGWWNFNYGKWLDIKGIKKTHVEDMRVGKKLAAHNGYATTGLCTVPWGCSRCSKYP